VAKTRDTAPSLKKILSFVMNLGAPDLGIDLGTANTLVCIPGKGVVLMEPSVVAVKVGSKPTTVPLNGRAVGYEAKRMIERVPENIRAIRPLKDGVIADFELTEIMLRYFIKRVQKHAWGGRPRMVISVPSGITAVEGKFDAGDVVRIAGADGAEFARGLTNYSVEEVAKIKGRKTGEIEGLLGHKYYDEVVHRDNLALTD